VVENHYDRKSSADASRVLYFTSKAIVYVTTESLTRSRPPVHLPGQTTSVPPRIHLKIGYPNRGETYDKLSRQDSDVWFRETLRTLGANSLNRRFDSRFAWSGDNIQELRGNV
jgi:hypothetical protein